MAANTACVWRVHMPQRRTYLFKHLAHHVLLSSLAGLIQTNQQILAEVVSVLPTNKTFAKTLTEMLSN
jgi:hypothetical protein